MQIELRNIQYAQFASEETNCFEGTIYLDGKRALTVRNAGHGGCNDYHDIIPGSESRLRSYCKTMPATEYEGNPLEMDADIFIGDLLEKWLTERDIKRALASKIHCTIKGKAGIFTFKMKYTPAIADRLRLKRQDIDLILNELPINAVIPIWK